MIEQAVLAVLCRLQGICVCHCVMVMTVCTADIRVCRWRKNQQLIRCTIFLSLPISYWSNVFISLTIRAVAFTLELTGTFSHCIRPIIDCKFCNHVWSKNISSKTAKALVLFSGNVQYTVAATTLGAHWLPGERRPVRDRVFRNL